jgi:hypothetical protein
MMQRRKLESVLLKGTIVILSVIFIYLGGAFLLGKNLKSILVNTLNNELQVKVNVKNIELDVLSNFPLIAIRFHKLCIDESYAYYNDCLLNAPALTMTFNPFKVIGKKLEVHRLYIHKGKIKLYSDDMGHVNFSIFKPSEENSDATDIEIREIRLIKTNVQYFDPLGLSTNFTTGKLGLNFKLNEKGYRLKLSGNTFFDHLMYGDKVYLFGRRVSADGQFIMNADASLFKFESFKLSLDQLPLQTDGSIRIERGNPNFDLKLTGEKLELVQLFSLLPPDIAQNLPELRSTGSLGVRAEIRGLMSDEELPYISLNFNLSDAKLLKNGKATDLEEIELNGQWTQDAGKKAFDPVWKINLVKAVLGNDRIKGSAERKQDSEWIDWKISGRVHLQRLKNLLDIDDEFQGDIQMNMLGKWPYQDLESSLPVFDGDIVAKDVVLPQEWTQTNISRFDADLHFETKRLTINKLAAQKGGSDFLFKGVADNYSSLVSKEPQVKLKGEWTSGFLNMNDLLAIFENEEGSPEKEGGNTFIMDSIKVDLRFIINRFEWDSIKLDHLKSNLWLNQNNLRIEKLTCNSMGGQWLASAQLRLSEEPLVVQTDVQCKGANIDHIFQSFNNFGQEEITNENLSGKINASAVATLPLTAKGDINIDHMELSAYLTIIDGRMKDYATLYELSRFVHIEDLKDIRFDTLENSLHIANGEIAFPEMSINNSALSLNLSGNHTFNNYMNYHLSVEVGELLAAKARWIEKLQNDKIEKRNNRMKVYLQIQGTPEDLEISYDRKTAASDIKEDIGQKGQQLRDKIKAAANDKESNSSKADDWWDD